MSVPREVIPGRVYMITRRCTQRQFLMRPDQRTNNAFIYCLAVAAARYDVDVLFTIAMSNHHHTGIHDRLGNYPEFLAYFHRLFAKCQNVLRGRWENFWSSEQTSVVRLDTIEDLVARMTYALTNPVKDGLVERAHHWPGVSSLSCLLNGVVLAATRPLRFFREDGPMPARVTLPIQLPQSLQTMKSADIREHVLAAIARTENDMAARRAASGARVLGRRQVLAQDPSGRPTTDEPRRTLGQRLAAANTWGRIEALLRNRAFRDAYTQARAAFLSGVENVIFPAGTYWLRRFSSARCEPAPA